MVNVLVQLIPLMHPTDKDRASIPTKHYYLLAFADMQNAAVVAYSLHRA